MEKYQEKFAKFLADSGALFFSDKLNLKDGRPTPYFVNIGNVAEKASIRDKLAVAFADMIEEKMSNGMKIDIVFGPSYKASLIAGDATLRLLDKYGIDIGCCYDRKELKTHGEGSTNASGFVGAKFFEECNIYMIDDVGTSMKTKRDGLEKVACESKRLGVKSKVVGIGIAVDREQVGPVYDTGGKIVLGERGDDAIGNFIKDTGIPVDSIVGIREVIDYLHKAKHPLKINDKIMPVDKKTYDKFQEYMRIYGVDRKLN